MPIPPQGTVTLLFTDIEGSTRLLQEMRERYADLLAEHSQQLRQAAQAHHGYEVDTQGDSFLFAFGSAQDALLAAVAAQRALHEGGRPTADGGRSAASARVGIRVRMGLHTGEPQWTGERYIGLDLHRGARIMAAGHGGQILMSQTTYELVQGDLPSGVSLRDVGLHRLKDLRRPRQLYQVVIAGLPDEFPPLKTLDARPNNLPSALTPLVGREVETRHVASLLRRDDVHLVTLMGPGGVGKTRLSLQVAADLLEEFADGVYFVSLAAISDPAHVIGTVAQTLGVREQGGQSLLAALTDHLRDRRLLLVLDNFEQVTAAAPQVAPLLSQCPRLKVLVTSRAPLRLRGEHEYPVAPLALPPPPDGRQLAEGRYARQKAEGGATDYASRITQYPSVELFVQRAQAIKPDFQVTQANAQIIADICYRLDGLPLAIELAAARIRLLSPQALLTRLDQRLKLLTGGPRDLPERHQTLRGAIEWSYDLLDAERAALFRRLAVFAGGAALEAVEAVGGDEGGRTTEGGGQRVDDVLGGLEALINESLMVARDQSDGQPRFYMLETIREFAQEQLERTGEADSLRRRHALYFLHLAEAVEPKLRGADQTAALQQLDAEIDNLRAALTWLRTAGADLVEVALRLVYSLSRYWYIRGYFSEGRTWLLAFLAAPAPAGVAPATDTALTMSRARVAGAAGVLAWAQGDYPAARAAYEESLSLRTVLGDQAGAATMLSNLGLLAHEAGDYPEARSLFERSLTLRRQLDDRSEVPSSLINLALTLRDQGDYAEARALLDEALGLTRQLNDAWRIAICLNNLGEVALSQGRGSEARALYEEALALRRHLGDRRGVASSLNGLARCALEAQQFEAALPHLKESLAIRQTLGDRRGLIECLENYAIYLHHQGQGDLSTRIISGCDGLRASLKMPRPDSDAPRFARLVASRREQAAGERLSTLSPHVQPLDLAQLVALVQSDTNGLRP